MCKENDLIQEYGEVSVIYFNDILRGLPTSLGGPFFSLTFNNFQI